MPAIGGTGVTDLTFQPPALDSSLYYRRVVKSDTITDISREVIIFVYPAIGSNTITGEDTLCYNGDAKPLKGAIISPTGGNNAYNYQWHQSIDQAYWDTVGYEASFDPGALITTIYYRRVVNSTKYCYDTSNTVIITVLPSITNNLFSSDNDTSICMNTSPGTLNTMIPAGGNETFTYSWQYKTIHGNWTDVQDSSRMSLTIGVLTDTASYRRIVYSGNHDACIDTMQAAYIKTIIVRSPIANNGILGAPVQYTCFNTPFQLQGSAPQQGFLEYAYQWERSSDNTAWEALSTVSTDYQNYLTTNLIEAGYFRRTVYSSASLRECADTSNVLEVRINPLPAGNVIDSDDALCAGENLFVKFNVAGNSPFNVIINGGALGNSTKTNVSNTLDSVGFVTTGPASFIILSIEDDSSCFANPANFISVTPATVYDVPVADAGYDAEVCSDSYDLQASKDITGSTGLWTATGATFEDVADQNSRVTIDSYGPKVFTWTETSWHCSDTDEVTIIFYEEPQAPNAGPDLVLEFNYLTQLQALPASVGKGKWSIISGSGEFTNDTLPDAFVSELANNNSLRWTVTNGNCDAVADNMNILINPLKIIKAFTPNGDTDNPSFELGADNAEKIRLKVFNSSGVLVYESEDYQQDGLWEGKNMDGVDLPEGTYYYIAYIKVAGKEQEVQFRSFVEIIR
jgi:gliding motility-associated-like protein